MEVLTPEQAFGSVVHSYDLITRGLQDQADRLILEVLSLLNPSSKILDIGCATGTRTSIHFANGGHRVIGIDIAEQMVEFARKNVPAATFMKMDMLDYQPPIQGDYDVVVAAHSLYYFPIPRLRNLLYKMSYAVKTGGYVIIIISRPEDGTVHIKDNGWTDPVTRPFLGHTIQRIFGTMDAWKGLIEEAGLKILRIDKQRIEVGATNAEQEVYISFGFVAQKVVKNALLSPYPLQDRFGEPIPAVQPGKWKNFMKHVERADIAVLVQNFKDGAYQKTLAVGLGANDLCEALKSTGEVAHAISLEDHLTAVMHPLFSEDEPYDALAVLWSPMFVADPNKFLKDLLRFTSPSCTAFFSVVIPLHNAEIFNITDAAFNRYLENPRPRHHHGFLLQIAETLLRTSGFSYIKYIPIDLVVNFPNMSSEAGIKEASSIIAECWSRNNAEEPPELMTTALAQSLREFFSIRPRNIRCQSVILVAKRQA